jgi:PAS domain S-box-containing protein
VRVHNVFGRVYPDSTAQADLVSRMSQLVEKILTQEAPSAPGYDALFERSPVAAFVFAANGAIVTANAAAHRLLRCAPGSLAGQSAALFFPELWRGSARHSVEVSQFDPPRRICARGVDGATVHCRLAMCQVGTVAEPRFLATLEDLTEFEEQRTASAAAVAAANKEFETFIDVAAHDLRAPLRILMGFTDALADECGAMLNDEGRTFLKEILQAGSRMEGMIDGMLTLARSGRAEMACESLDLTTLVEIVYYELRHADTQREVEALVDPDLKAWGDVRLMMTLLRALIGNAWKFTARTSAAKVRVHAEQRDGETWLCVSDNGGGFDMAQAGRLFQPFTRLHRHDEFPGHGLGLATVQCILRRHGGRAEVQSVPGQGTTVRFWLPRAPD